MSKLSRAAGAVVLAALVAVTSACAGNAEGGSAGPSDTLRLAAVASGPFTQQFNPLLQASKDAAGDAQVYLYEPLLMDNYADGTSKPWLVASYTWSKDGKTLTLKLRPGVTWSDGQALTAEDVAYTFELMRKQKALNFYGLPLAGESAPSADTAVITFTEPGFQYQWWATTPVPKHVFASVKDPVKFTNPHPVTSGPYVVKSFSPQVITLDRNTHYWGPAPAVQHLQLLSYDSASSMVAALRAGQVDWITPQVSNPESIVKLDPGKIGYWQTNMSSAIIFMIPNDSQYPLSLAPVRRAISQAIDRSSVSKLAFGGANAPFESPTGLDPKTRAKLIPAQFRDVTLGGANPGQAAQTLQAAGFTKRGGLFTDAKGAPLQFSITVPTSSPYGDLVRAATMMVSQLKAAGIGASVKAEAPVAWREDIGLGHYQLAIRGAGGSLSAYTLFDTIFDQKLKPEGKSAKQNFERYKNAQAGQLLAQYAAAPPDSAAEASAAGGLATLMAQDAPVIPLFHVSYFALWRKDRFTGWPSDANPYALPIGGHINSVKVVLALKPAK